MPKAVVINPNTSEAMSADIRSTAERVFRGTWTSVTVNAPAGPESLESWRDYAFAAVSVMPLVGDHPEADGFVLACFGDPGLYALKEISLVPVVGIAEAAMSQALLVGGKFGILAGMDRAAALMDNLVKQYGLEGRYAGTVPLSMRVLSFEEDREGTLGALEAAARSLAKRGADVLLLGCAGLTGFRGDLAGRTGLAVIDPVEAGCRSLAALVEAGVGTGRSGLYARPSPQRMNGLEGFLGASGARRYKAWEKD